MSCYRLGYRFLLNNYIPDFGRVRVSQQIIRAANENYPILVYEPPGKVAATLITFSGFSVHGYRDKRLARLSRAFARQGMRVVTPYVADIDQLRIHPVSIDKFAALIEAIRADDSINSSKRAISIFAASYSGGIAMLAAARYQTASCVNTICLLGAFADFRNVLRFVVEEEAIDEYARYILLRNFLQRSDRHNNELVNLLDVAIADNGFRRKVPRLPQVLQATSPDNIGVFWKMLNDVDFRRGIVYGAFADVDQSESWAEKFNLADKLEQVTFSVNLIHGQRDRVIPSSESIQLHDVLQHQGKHSHLTLSNLLDHGDLIVNHALCKEISKLSLAFGVFIEASLAPQD
ncbi:MAG: alpha/beta hydrolase [Nitrosomonas halophila]